MTGKARRTGAYSRVRLALPLYPKNGIEPTSSASGDYLNFSHTSPSSIARDVGARTSANDRSDVTPQMKQLELGMSDLAFAASAPAASPLGRISTRGLMEGKSRTSKWEDSRVARRSVWLPEASADVAPGRIRPE